MSNLSGIRDVDREILSKLDDRELLKVCSVDKYTWSTVCDDAFLRRRLLAKYPQIEKEKTRYETWRNFFLRAVHYISKMKEDFDYDYTFGNFVKQYYILKEHSKIKNTLFVESAKQGELGLVIWSLKNGANIHFLNYRALRIASANGQLEVVKYLVEMGSDIHALNDTPLRLAYWFGHTEIVNYLLEHGATF